MRLLLTASSLVLMTVAACESRALVVADVPAALGDGKQYDCLCPRLQPTLAPSPDAGSDAGIDDPCKCPWPPTMSMAVYDPIHEPACDVMAMDGDQPFVLPKEPAGASSASATTAMAKSLAGSWIGFASGGDDPGRTGWGVSFSFVTDDGATSGRYAAIGGGGPALGWGSDTACGAKTWRLTDLDPDGTVSGAIDVTTNDGNGGCVAEPWHGALRGVTLDATGFRLRFVVVNPTTGATVTFELWRPCTAS